MQRTLERELKVPESAEWEANGTSPLGEIVARDRDWLWPQASLWQWALKWARAVVLALCVIISSR